MSKTTTSSCTLLGLLLMTGCTKSDPSTMADTGDGVVCPNGDPVVGYADIDGDGFGVASGRMTTCDALPEGYADTSNDCDDTNPAVFPGADELCDGVDNDCDAETDESAIDERTFYRDSDNDGYGDASDTIDACSLPDGYVLWPGDCDESDPLIHPEADEICDEIDNDCNELVDDSLDCDET